MNEANESTQSTMGQDDDVNVRVVDSGLPRISDAVAQRAADLGIRIVETSRNGNALDITIAGSAMEDVIGVDAQKFVYDARVDYGFERGGLDRVVNRGVDDKGQWRATWKFLRPI